MGVELVCVQTTAPASITALTEGAAQIVADTGVVNLAAPTAIEIVQSFPWWGNSGSAVNLYNSLWDNGVVVNRPWDGRPRAAGQQEKGVMWRRRFTAAAGAHQWTSRFHTDGGTGLVECGAGGAGADLPALFRVALLDGANEIDRASNAAASTTINGATAISEATAVTIVGPITLQGDGVTPFWIEFALPAWSMSDATSTLKLFLSDGSTSLGNLMQGRAYNPNNFVMGSTYPSRQVLAPGSHQLFVRGWIAGGGTATLFAGNGGGGGANGPMYLSATV